MLHDGNKSTMRHFDEQKVPSRLPGKPADDAPPGGWSTARFDPSQAAQDWKSGLLLVFQLYFFRKD